MTPTDVKHISEMYKAGMRYFTLLDFDKGEKLTGEIFKDTIFDDCCFSIDFSGSDFTNTTFVKCNLKGCDFSKCNLTNTTFENCLLETAEFKNAKTQGIVFRNCHCYGQLVSFDPITGELESFKTPLVKELYDHVPEFNKISDHMDDELDYVVFGHLSLELFNSITTNTELTDLTKQCFKFFNLIGDRQDYSIDNLLVVGVYEGLYANKKCNDVARQLLTDRNKEVYEYSMINGNIRSDY